MFVALMARLSNGKGNVDKVIKLIDERRGDGKLTQQEWDALATAAYDVDCSVAILRQKLCEINPGRPYTGCRG